MTKEQLAELNENDLTTILIGISQKNCNIDKTKDKQYFSQMKSRTKGLLLAMSNNGLIFSYKEIFFSESCTQVAMFYFETIANFHGKKFPEYLIYDNGCTLIRYLINKNAFEKTETGRKAKNVKVVVDRLHIQNHTENWCRDNCHPNLFPDLKDKNTMVCEQANSWLSRYKGILKYMNYTRYMFFLYIICNAYNENKSKIYLKNQSLLKNKKIKI